MVQTAKNQLFVAPVSPTEPLKPDVFHSQTLSPLEIVLFATFTHYRSICEAHIFQKTTFYHVRHGYLLVSPFSSGLNLQTNNSKQLLSKLMKSVQFHDILLLCNLFDWHVILQSPNTYAFFHRH